MPSLRLVAGGDGHAGPGVLQSDACFLADFRDVLGYTDTVLGLREDQLRLLLIYAGLVVWHWKLRLCYD